jgi:hypothetical protein
MATTIRERMLALLKRRDREGLSFRALSEISGEPIWRLAYYHRILFKTHPGFVEVTPTADVVSDSAKTFDVTLTSGVRIAVPTGFDASELRRLVSTLDARC